MKKSSTLMLSYIIFLVATVIIRFCFGWTGLGQVALAATIAGCFFAFADLMGWYISHKKPLVEAMQEDLKVFKRYGDTAQEYIRRDIQGSEQAMALVRTYADEENRVKQFISVCEAAAPRLQEMIEDIERYKSAMDETEEVLKEDSRKLFWIGVFEVAFAICGFIAFFLLLCFGTVVEIVAPYGEVVTVLAFAIIMLNYFLRDVLEDHAKKDLEDINKHIQQEKNNIEEINAKMAESKYVEAAEKLVEVIEECKKTEDNADGQVENALGE